MGTSIRFYANTAGWPIQLSFGVPVCKGISVGTAYVVERGGSPGVQSPSQWNSRARIRYQSRPKWIPCGPLRASGGSFETKLCNDHEKTLEMLYWTQVA